MALNAIILHMLCCGFAYCEMTGNEAKGRRYMLACLIPAPGFLGVVLWNQFGPWIVVPASAVAGVMLPIAYIGFFLLNNNREFLGDRMPTGSKRVIWNAAMVMSISCSVGAVIYYLYIILQ